MCMMVTNEAHSRSVESGDLDGSEKQSQDDSSSPVSLEDSVGPDDEIAFHYLTFETKLPSPAYLSRSTLALQQSRQPPECPDLKQYTNPFLWPARRKHLMSWLGAIATTITAYSAGAYAPGIDQYTKEWHISQPAAEVGITVFTAGKKSMGGRPSSV